MYFSSDNAHGVPPELISVLAEANAGMQISYGGDEWSRRAESLIGAFFERDVRVFAVSTGTAANSLALSLYARPYGAILAHAESHIMQDECGAPEFYCGGAKMLPLAGAHGKIAAEEIAPYMDRAREHAPHSVLPMVLSLSQATEAGTVYRCDELASLGAVARAYGLAFHMDGARLANALCYLDCSAAAMTWQCGVDIVSFGLTKNGAFNAEMIVLFDGDRADELFYRIKRSGHLLSKGRWFGAQIVASFSTEGDSVPLWRVSAQRANGMAQRLAAGIEGYSSLRLAHPVEANEIFVQLPCTAIAALRRAGAVFYDWPRPAMTNKDDSEPWATIRLVTSFATTPTDVDRFLGTLEIAMGNLHRDT